MKLGCSIFNISEELGKVNIAVGLLMMGLFIGVGTLSVCV